MEKPIKELYKTLSNSDNTFFCPLPFSHLYNDSKGQWGLAYLVQDHQNASIIQYYKE